MAKYFGRIQKFYLFQTENTCNRRFATDNEGCEQGGPFWSDVPQCPEHRRENSLLNGYLQQSTLAIEYIF